MLLYTKIQQFIDTIETDGISTERKKVLDPFVQSLRDDVKSQSLVNINFICTHNSRRSHLGQIWAKTMATYYGLHHVHTYSGGTEATAIYKSVLKALEHSGFESIPLSETTNPVFGIKMGEELEPIVAFSKKYYHQFNPASNFFAVLTCDSADENCPVIFGAKKRFPIKYIDPKVSDGTPQEDEIYQQRSLQIAQEMKYVFSQLNG
ncbi:arsenate reductase [Spirosomataceae bacterium TFI 002]|nr:arsenate reductase [Spirosomataceae bacterium TFI 002]